MWGRYMKDEQAPSCARQELAGLKKAKREKEATHFWTGSLVVMSAE